MIQTFAANRANQSLDVGILPRRLRCREHVLNAQPTGDLMKLLSVTPVSIPQQITWDTIPREGFQQLVSHPFGGAFVSVAVRGQPPAFDVLEDRRATFAYGVVRTMVAMTFASLMYLLVLGQILLPELAKDSIARLLVVAFIAGFSEKFVPEAVIHHAISR